MNTLMLIDRIDKYCKRGKYPTSPLERFAIGFYQIHQGIGWEGTDSSYEAYAAAIIHFLGVTTQLDLPIHELLPEDLNIFFPEYNDLLYCLSRAQQMVFYQARVNNTKRSKSRNNPEQLYLDLTRVIICLLQRIPKKKLKQAFETAFEIMEGNL